MKKSLLLISFLGFTTVFAQCIIKGNPAMKVNDTEIYTVESDNAQCTDCHLWTNIGGNASLEGNVKQKSVKLRANSGGRTILSLTVLSPQGMQQCSKNIDITDFSVSAAPKAPPKVISNPNCDIDFNDYKEVKFSDGIVSLMSNTDNNFKYEWTAVYMSGEQKTSKDKTPQFNYSKENGIRTIKVQIISSKCMKNFSKAYETAFWSVL